MGGSPWSEIYRDLQLLSTQCTPQFIDHQIDEGLCGPWPDLNLVRWRTRRVLCQLSYHSHAKYSRCIFVGVLIVFVDCLFVCLFVCLLTEVRVAVHVSVDDYQHVLMQDCMVQVYLHAKVVNTKQTYARSDNFLLTTPEITITVCSNPSIQPCMMWQNILHNPLQCLLNLI